MKRFRKILSAALIVVALTCAVCAVANFGQNAVFACDAGDPGCGPW